MKSAVEKLLRGAIPHAELRYRVKQPDGCYVEVLDRMFAFPNPVGPPRKLIGSLYVIDSAADELSDQTSLKDLLAASDARFQTFVNFLPTLAWETDPDGWIFFYNQRWYDYTGTTPRSDGRMGLGQRS